MAQTASKRRRVVQIVPLNGTVPARREAKATFPLMEGCAVDAATAHRTLLTERALRCTTDARLQDECRALLDRVTQILFRSSRTAKEFVQQLPSHTQQHLSPVLPSGNVEWEVDNQYSSSGGSADRARATHYREAFRKVRVRALFVCSGPHNWVGLTSCRR